MLQPTFLIRIFLLSTNKLIKLTNIPSLAHVLALPP